MVRPVMFRWLGVAGVELTANGQALAVDPFFSRPPVRQFLLGRPQPDRALIRRNLPTCDYVLVSHAHWDHLMDVPEVALHTGAVVFGSPNTCRLLALLGVPSAQIREIGLGDRFVVDGFRVEVRPADHSFIPFMSGSGRLAPGLRPPLRLRDYRMDVCFSFLVEVAGYRLLLQPGPAVRADLLFVVPAKRPPDHYATLLRGVRPGVVVPVHWDNMFSPLSRPLREYTRPGGMSTAKLKAFVDAFVPGTRFLMPAVFQPYDVATLLGP